MELHTQKSFDDNIKDLNSTPKESKTTKEPPKKKWIKECWDHHSQHVDECDIAPDWGDWETDWNMCWCCGQRTSHLQNH